MCKYLHLENIEAMYTRLLSFVILTLAAIILNSCNIMPDKLVDAITGSTLSFSKDGNSHFHQTDEVSLAPGELVIDGEVKNSGRVDLKNYYKREVIIKESLFDTDSGILFTGAYRYKGYSLFDLLHPFNLEKKNTELFRPQTDVYIAVENSKGESVVFSWSEIFHTTNPHQVLIATEMAPVVPYRTEVDYPVGEKWRVVSAGDLFAFRMLEDPVKITVHSFDRKDFPINRDITPLFSPSVSVVLEETEIHTITAENDAANHLTYHSTFYGMGMGYHPAENFTGPTLMSMLDGVLNPFDARLNRSGLVCFASLDGYRAIYSYSELFNRADQTPPLLAITENRDDGGYYRNFLPGDFYADRSVKALREMYIFLP
jgi:hypothetical protein